MALIEEIWGGGGHGEGGWTPMRIRVVNANS